MNSVQHYSIGREGAAGDENIPEWKKRLARGETVGGEGSDLFAPTALEVVFQEPVAQCPVSDSEKPWHLPDDFQSTRFSRTRVPVLEALEEEEEEASMNSMGSSQKSSDGSAPVVDDPRLRTLSGQEEVQNENMSLVTGTETANPDGGETSPLLSSPAQPASSPSWPSDLSRGTVEHESRLMQAPSPRNDDSIEGPSLTTQDYVKQAQQIMQMIRQRPDDILEESEHSIVNPNLSLVHVSQPGAVTPAPTSRRRPISHQKIGSMIWLTPLSEFTVHQIDRPLEVENSYVAARPLPNALKHAHGTLSLAVDELMRAITDAQPDELYWEQIRQLDLHDRGLDSLHRLQEYCPTLEEISASGNRLSQLTGVPSHVRTASLQSNQLSSLTSWGHLHNLQYLDISANKLQSLDGLGCLIHLRELRAKNNQIQSLDGIRDLDGLLHLELQNNEMAEVNFEYSRLSRLRLLDLSGNKLSKIENCHQLTSLRTLYLRDNDLAEFNAENGAFAKLKRLFLSHNKIQTIALSKFPLIGILALDHNRIRDLPGLAQARHLHTLSLREQSDSPDLLNTIFCSSSECRTLYLSSNAAPAEGLRVPPQPHYNLKYLELASCGLTCLPRRFGRFIPNCRALNLNFNAIEALDYLGSCRKLREIMIVGNRLSRLRRTCKAVSRIPVLAKVDMRDNPLTVGFYPPLRHDRLLKGGDAGSDIQDAYLLSPADKTQDTGWIQHLDEGTKLKRGLIELFLATGSRKLRQLDGLCFDRKAVSQQDELWQSLIDAGVLVKSKSRKPVAQLEEAVEDGESEDLPLDAEVDE